MRKDEIAEVKSENERLRIQHVSDPATIAELLARVTALENQLTKNSDNSYKLPSSDNYTRSPKKRSLRAKSGKKAGGQKGHEGRALCQREKPDFVVDHYPAGCESCQQTFLTEMVTAAPSPNWP
jgi:transposase